MMCIPMSAASCLFLHTKEDFPSAPLLHDVSQDNSGKTDALTLMQLVYYGCNLLIQTLIHAPRI